MTISGPSAIRSVAVVGGGTAGYFAALALKSHLPRLEISLIESSKIPIIGVGEATTPLMPPFLHRQLGIDIVELYREVRPTWKLGIKFDWGRPGDYYFTYPFGAANPIEAYAHDGSLRNQSIGAQMMAAARTPIIIDTDGQLRSLLPEMKFAYHLDNKSFVAYLAQCARRAGIRHVDAEIIDVRTAPDGEDVERLILADGQEVRADLYVDASGFRSLLIEKALGSPFISFSSSLFCDSAIFGEVPQKGTIEPYTTAETMDAGWCWRIPVEGEDHRGYVYSSTHVSAAEAEAEMRAKNPGLGATRSVRFRSGRHRDFWKGNTVAVGNAYGFVEPLESTALHMVIVELSYLLSALQTAREGVPDRGFANRSVGEHWDYLRWFLAIHYKFNGKLQTPFWRDCRATVDVSGMQPFIERFSTIGPWDRDADLRYASGDPAFCFEGLMILLLGQDVPCPRPARTSLSSAQWNARVAEGRALVDRALPQDEALDLLRRHPNLLQEATSKRSWVSWGDELVIAGVGAARGILPPEPSMPVRGPYSHLFKGIAPPEGT